MGRTLRTYRMHLRVEQRKFMKLMKTLGLKHKGFDLAWSYAGQQAMSVSVFPHPKTSVITALSMIPGVYEDLDLLWQDELISRKNTFSSQRYMLHEYNPLFPRNFIDPWLLPGVTAMTTNVPIFKNHVKEELLAWFIPFLSPRAQQVMLKVLEKPELQEALGKHIEESDDGIILFLHYALYDVFLQVHQLRQMLDDLKHKRQETTQEPSVRRQESPRYSTKTSLRNIGRPRMLRQSYKYYKQTRLDIEG